MPSGAQVEPIQLRWIEDGAATLITGDSGDLSSTIKAISSMAGVSVCAVYHDRTGSDLRRLILVFGHYLATIRGAGTFVITVDTPRAPVLEDRIVIPHFVGVRQGLLIQDAVVWEWAAPALLAQWTGDRAFDTHAWQTRVDGLIALRRVFREGGLAPTRHRALLLALRGRYLSFKFVAQHQALVLKALDDLSKAQALDPDGRQQ